MVSVDKVYSDMFLDTQSYDICAYHILNIINFLQVQLTMLDWNFQVLWSHRVAKNEQGCFELISDPIRENCSWKKLF